MTDLNPTPNNKLAIGGVVGPGDIILGVLLTVVGILVDITPLTYVGLALLACGVLVTTWGVHEKRKQAKTPGS